MKTNGQVLAAAFGTFFALAAAFPPFVCAADKRAANPAGKTAMAKPAVAAVDAPEDPEIEAIISGQLPKIKRARGSDKIELLGRFHIALQLVEGRRGKLPLEKTKKMLSRDLITQYNEISGTGDIAKGIKANLLILISRYGDSGYAKPFLINVLEKGGKDEQDSILPFVGCALSGDDAYDEIESLAKRGIIEECLKYSLLARINKARALPMIREVVDTTNDRTLFMHAASELHDPQDFKRIIPRIREIGLNKLFWIDANMLCDYIDSVNGKDAQAALDLIARTGLPRVPALERPVAIFQRKLADGNLETRISAVKALKMTAEHEKGVDHILEILKSAQNKETNPAVKAEIRETITLINRQEERWKKHVQRLEEAKRKLLKTTDTR